MTFQTPRIFKHVFFPCLISIPTLFVPQFSHLWNRAFVVGRTWRWAIARRSACGRTACSTAPTGWPVVPSHFYLAALNLNSGGIYWWCLLLIFLFVLILSIIGSHAILSGPFFLLKTFVGLPNIFHRLKAAFK